MVAFAQKSVLPFPTSVVDHVSRVICYLYIYTHMSSLSHMSSPNREYEKVNLTKDMVLVTESEFSVRIVPQQSADSLSLPSCSKSVSPRLKPKHLAETLAP